MLNVKTRFVGGNTSRSAVSQYMGETFMERLEVTLQGPTINVPLFPMGFPTSITSMTPDPGKETRYEFGERLRRAAREATRGFEKAILDSLREQGHLV